MRSAKIIGRQRLRARLAAIPKAVKDATSKQLDIEVAELVAAMRRAAPVDATAANPGAFRDSIHAYRNPDRPLSYRIIADARDEDGNFIGAHIEHGHRARDGSHVAGQPSFFPTYRARKKPMKRRMSAAARKALRQIFPR